MKIKILAFTLLFLVLFSVTALAATPEENNISLSFDKDYLVITQDNISENKELIENLGYTTKSFKALFTESSLVAFILHSESKSQIQLRAYSTQFSKQIEDIGLLSEDNLISVAEQLVPDYTEIISINDTYYICTETSVKDDTGEYLTEQYVTLKNGKLYMASIYCSKGNGGTSSEILSSFTIETEKKTSGVTFVLSVILVIVFILAFVALAVYVIVLIIIQVRQREDNDVREFVRIKRRRF